MASVIPHGNTFRIGFTGLDRKRRTIYAGAISERNAHELRRLVERILEAAALGESLDPKTASRIAALPDTTYEKLVGVALVNPREKRGRVTVAAHAEAYLALRSDVKPSTRLVLGHVVRNLVDHFGDKPLADVTPGDCDDFGRWLTTNARSAGQVKRKGAALSPATVGKRLQWCSSVFRDAQRRGLISANPFADVKKPGGTNPDRQEYVPAATVETLIEADPDPEWRALLALARYLGLRTPSEPFSLCWSHVDWERKRLHIPSPKTECHGKPYRVAPILPEVMPHLESLYALAPEGSRYVFERLRERGSIKAAERGFWASLNLRTGLLRKMEKAGIAPWPKLWHALRARAETDLAARFPIHVVAGWLGNTPKIAAKHYLMTTDADFDSATGDATHFTTHGVPKSGETQRKATHGNAKNPAKHGVSALKISGERT
jgi:integrase